MDFRATCALFGGTVFYEDLRSDLVRIDAELQAFESRDPQDGTDEAASLLLSRAIWHMQKGDFHSARTALETLTQHPPYSRRWRFRSTVYMTLWALWRERPPLLTPCDFEGPAMLMWKRKVKEDKLRSIDFLTRCHDDLGAAGELDRLEYEVIKLVCEVRHPATDRARRLAPDSESFIADPDERQSHIEYIGSVLYKVDRLWNKCTRLEMPLVAAYIWRLGYELCHYSSYGTTPMLLENLRQEYRAVEDEIGQGIYWMLRGDRAVAPSHTSPLVYNFDIVDFLDEFNGECSMGRVSSPPESTEQLASSHAEWTELEARLQSLPEDIARVARRRIEAFRAQSTFLPPSDSYQEFESSHRTALICYSEAQKCFVRGGCSRGQALVALKESCVFHIADYTPPEKYTAANIARVSAKLQESETACHQSGDTQLQNLRLGHWLAHQQMSVTQRDAARDLATWTSKNDNRVLGLCIALILFKKASFQRYLCGDFQTAYQSSEHARQLIKSMDVFKTVWIQVMLFQVSLRKSMGLHKAAVIWLEFIRDHWDRLLTQEVAVLLRSEVSQEQVQGFTIVARIIQSALDYVVSLTPHISGPLEHWMTALNLKFVLDNRFDEYTQNWKRQFAVRLKYAEALPSRTRHQPKQHGVNSWKTLQSFVETHSIDADTDLQAKSCVISALVEARKVEAAASILDSIANEDQLTHNYPSLGRANQPEQDRFALRHRVKSLETIFLLSIQCRCWDRAKRLMDRIEELSPGYFTSVSSYTKLWPWQRCLYAGLVYEHDRQFNLAIQYFNQAWLFLTLAKRSFQDQDAQRLLWEMPLVSRLTNALVRRQLLWNEDQPTVTKISRVTDERFDRTVFRMFDQESEYGDHEHWNEALVFLEESRSHYAVESAAESAEMNPELRQLLYQHRLWLELHLKPDDQKTWEEKQESRRLDGLKDHLEDRIRSSVRNANEGSGHLQVSDYYAAIPPDAIVVYTAISDDGIMLFCIDSTGLKVAYMRDDITPADIRELIHILVGVITDDELRESQEDGVFRFLLEQLSNLLIPPPVERCISYRSHVIFVPSGDLGRLPFGALLFQGDYLQLQREVSQVASLKMLLYLCNRPDPWESGISDAIRVIARPGNPRDPHGYLPMAGIEALYLARLLGTKAINAKDVSRTDFQQHLRDAAVLHISTHGFDDPAYPFNSHILLKEPFRVLDLLAVHTNLCLVTFSACLSSLGPTSEAGDIQGFSHRILAAGANAFIGALWEVNDIATMLHMQLFYTDFFFNRDGPTIAEAWHTATVLLYTADHEDIVTLLEKILKVWDILESEGKRPNDFVRGGRRKLEGVIKQFRAGSVPKGLDFKHPRMWAAFVLVGNGFVSMKQSEARLEGIREAMAGMRMDDDGSDHDASGTAEPKVND